MAKGCTYTYKGITYNSYQELKERLINEQSDFYFAPFLTAIENKLGSSTMNPTEIKEIVDSISKEYMLRDDISVTLSELLSAATDNAKELILSKINAGPETAGVYAYLTMLGIPFKEISSMMTTPQVKWVIDNAKKNVYDTKTDFNSLKGSIKELQTGPNIFKHLDYDRVNILNEIVKENLQNPAFLATLSYGNKFKDADIIKQLLNTYKKEGPVFKLGNISSFILPVKWVEGEVNLNIPLKDIRELYESLIKGTTNEKGENVNFIPTNHAPVYFDSGSYSEDGDFEDFGYQDGETYVDNKMPVKVELSRYLTQVIDHIDNAPPSSDIANFGQILEDSEETIILGSMLSVNQGIKTDPYSQYAFTRRVSDYIIKKSRNYIETNKIEKIIDDFHNELVTKGLDAKYEKEIVENFDFLKFLGVGLTESETESYKAASKIWYNKIKSGFNILSIATETPHFKAMLSVVGLMENIKENLAVKHNLLNKLINDVYSARIIDSDGFNKTLSEKDFYKIMDFANDTIVLKWIRELPDINRKFTYSSNAYYETIDNVIEKINTDQNGEPLPLSLQTLDIAKAEDRLAFIDMIHEMMFVLKEGHTIIDGEFRPHPLLKNNAFIQSYEIDKKKDPITGKNTKFYKLPINVLSAMESNSHKFNQYLIGLSDLGQVTYNGKNVKDLLFLYNTFIHRDKINKNSLTKLFELSVSGIKGTLMEDFIKWGGKFDWDNTVLKSLKENKEYDYAIDDIIIKGLATKIFAKNLTNFKGKYAYSMVFDSTTGSFSKQYYRWKPKPKAMTYTDGSYVPYTHFSKDIAIALTAGSEVGKQLANKTEYEKTLSEINKRGINLNDIQINC